MFSSGWASGVNAYLVVLMLGILGRATDVGEIPDALTRTDVLVVAGVLYGMEFVADKIPYIDSTWDAISTAIRPTAGAVIAILIAGDASNLEQALYAVLGGGAALASHAVKSGLRVDRVDRDRGAARRRAGARRPDHAQGPARLAALGGQGPEARHPANHVNRSPVRRGRP